MLHYNNNKPDILFSNTARLYAEMVVDPVHNSLVIMNLSQRDELILDFITVSEPKINIGIIDLKSSIVGSNLNGFCSAVATLIYQHFANSESNGNDFVDYSLFYTTIRYIALRLVATVVDPNGWNASKLMLVDSLLPALMEKEINEDISTLVRFLHSNVRIKS